MREQPVLLETIAAAPPLDQLVDNGRQIQIDAAARQRIEVFEWDRQRMEALQLAQHIERRGLRPRIADTPEIAVEIKSAGHPVLLVSVGGVAAGYLLVCAL